MTSDSQRFLPSAQDEMIFPSLVRLLPFTDYDRVFSAQWFLILDLRYFYYFVRKCEVL